MSDRTPRVGQAIVFCDASAVDHDALVTCVHSKTCINLVFVSGDADRTDTYGRQIERPTSISHVGVEGTAHGFYWRFADEERNPIKAPLET